MSSSLARHNIPATTAIVPGQVIFLPIQANVRADSVAHVRLASGDDLRAFGHPAIVVGVEAATAGLDEILYLVTCTSFTGRSITEVEPRFAGYCAVVNGNDQDRLNLQIENGGYMKSGSYVRMDQVIPIEKVNAAYHHGLKAHFLESSSLQALLGQACVQSGLQLATRIAKQFRRPNSWPLASGTWRSLGAASSPAPATPEQVNTPWRSSWRSSAPSTAPMTLPSENTRSVGRGKPTMADWGRVGALRRTQSD